MKTEIKFLILIIALMSCSFLHSQNTLEEIVTWELDEGTTFRCANSNKKGGDLNNDGNDDFIHWNNGDPYTFQFFMGNETPNTTFDFEIEVPFGSGGISWGGDLNGDGYNDFAYNYATQWGDPGDIYICFGGVEIDLTPDLILYGGDYAPDPYNLNFGGHNGGYDFNGDGYDDILAGGSGPDMFFNGQVDIFFGGEVMDAIVDFHIQGACQESFGAYKTTGDINGDGYDDLIASRKIDPLNIDDIKFEIYLGGPDMDTIMDYEIPEIWIGVYDCIVNGDFNGDNYNDLLITGSLDGENGIVGIYYGNSNCEPILNIYYMSPNGGFSYVNINNDEYDDLVAIYKYEGSGHLNIFYGNEEYSFISNISYNVGTFNYQYGKIGCNAGDFNGDEEDEILVNDGIPYNSATMYGLPGGNNAGNYELEIINYKLQNYPNPFKPSGAGRGPGTTISYDLPVNIANPVIEIFNIKGEKIKTFNCQNQMSLIWDGTDNHQNQVSSGIYLYRIKTDEGVLQTKKMLLLK